MSKNWPATTAAFTEAAQQLQSARAIVGDISATLRDYAEGINAHPSGLPKLKTASPSLDRLKRKYGKTVAEVIAFGEDVARKLAEVEDRDEILKTLRAELVRSRKGLSKSRCRAHCRTQIRRNQACQASRDPDQLARHEGSLPDRRLHAQTKQGDPATGPPIGWDEVEYRIATNPGEPLKPLHEIASGGEMSRVMLALKVSCRRSRRQAQNQNSHPAHAGLR